MCDVVQSLTGLQETWERRLQDSGAAVHRSMGLLCLNMTLACYLSSVPHHTQMEVINVDLVPLLKERGMELYWGPKNSFMCNMPSLSSSSRKKTLAKSEQDASQNEHEDHNENNSGHATKIHSRKSSDNVEDHITDSFACLSEHLLSHFIPEALVDDWLSRREAFHSPCFLLFASLVHDSWNQWPLLYDPLGLASQWIETLHENIVCIDARDG